MFFIVIYFITIYLIFIILYKRNQNSQWIHLKETFKTPKEDITEDANIESNETRFNEPQDEVMDDINWDVDQNELYIENTKKTEIKNKRFSLQNAVVMKEILDKPVSMRNRK